MNLHHADPSDPPVRPRVRPLMQQIGCLLIRPFHLQRRKRARWAPCSVPSHPSVPPLGGRGTGISFAVGAVSSLTTTHFARLTFQGELRCPFERDGWHAQMSGAGGSVSFLLFCRFPIRSPAFRLLLSERASGQFICGAWAKKVFPLFKSLPRSGSRLRFMSAPPAPFPSADTCPVSLES